MICVICVVNIFMIGEWYVVGLVLLSVVFVYIAGRTVTVSRALSLQGAPPVSYTHLTLPTTPYV